MAQRGVWQLQKLIVSYCDWGGSSRGIRWTGEVRFLPLLEEEQYYCFGYSLRISSYDGLVFMNSFPATFMETHLPAYKEGNPQLEVVTELIRGQHPHFKAFYKNKNQRVVCVRNMSTEEVLHHATRLRNALGRKAVKLKTRHVTKHPSVQGTWTTALQF